jgi:DNA-binding HxlR family transcriptional regulator
MQERTFWEKLEGTTEQVIAQLKKLVEEGNVRRVVVKQHGRTVAEFPLTLGVIGTVLAPLVAAIGALTALLTECTIEVEKTTPPAGPDAS